MKKLGVISGVLALFFVLTGFSNLKIETDKKEQLLCSKKWTIVDVKRRKNDFEVGEVFSFTVDKKFTITKNDYAFAGGTWKLYKNRLILLFDVNQYGDNKKIPSEHKIKKLKANQMVLKYSLVEGKGKEKKKVKAKLYLR